MRSRCLGLTIVLGYTGQINLAQAAFFGLGAYSVALGTTVFALPFLVALVIGVVIAAVAAPCSASRRCASAAITSRW